MICVAVMSLNPSGNYANQNLVELNPIGIPGENNFLCLLGIFLSIWCVTCSNRQTELAVAVYLLRSYMLPSINASGIL